MNRTALIVSYYFPPLGMGGVQRMAKLAKYLPRFGYDVMVLTVKPIRYPAHDRSLLDELPGSVRIYRSGSSDPARIGRFIPLPSRANARIKTAAVNVSSKLWPDSKIGWKKPATQTAHKILADHRIDVVLSSSPPMTGHLVAMDLAASHAIPWVADFRDPWESRLPEELYADDARVEKAYQLLGEISDRADVITVVNDGILQNIFTTAKTILSGYDPDDFASVDSSVAGAEFSFCHLGTVGSFARMEPFFKAARLSADRHEQFANQVRFRFIGVNDTHALKQLAKSYGWEDRIDILGYLPHREALRETAHSPVYLLSIPAEYPFLTPGKLFDYLAMPGTILAAVPDDQAARIIRDYNAGICVDPNDNEELSRKMIRLFEDHSAGEMCQKGDVSRLTRIETARQFAAVFDEVIHV